MKKSIVAILMALSTIAFASEDRLTMLDADKDGAVSETEAAGDAGIAGGFKDADVNQDGKLDAAELGAIK